MPETHVPLEDAVRLYWSISLMWRGRAPFEPTHTVGDALVDLGELGYNPNPRLARRARELGDKIVFGFEDDDVRIETASNPHH